MVDELLMAGTRVINVDELLYWLGAIMSILTVVTAITLPLRKMLKKYDDKLQDSERFIRQQTKLNADYQLLLDESKKDRTKLNEDIAAIKKATLMQIKLEINKIADRALKRKFAYSWECETVELLYQAYVPLGGNSNTQEKVIRMRKMPIEYCSEEDYVKYGKPER